MGLATVKFRGTTGYNNIEKSLSNHRECREAAIERRKYSHELFNDGDMF